MKIPIFVFAVVFWVVVPKQGSSQSTQVMTSLHMVDKLDQVSVYTTAQNTDLRLSLSQEEPFLKAQQPLETQVAIFVQPDKTYQTMVGIGGALTDASAEVYASLDEARQQQFMQAYFDQEKGIGYTFARTHIHSCDFSSESYTYVSNEDKALSSFSIDKDQAYRIPFIKEAMNASEHGLKLFVSPWSPPAFMKSNGDMLQGGSLLPDFQDSWALYFAKFIKAYEAAGIPIWGLTIQNEPMATQIWESCIFTAEQERDFLVQYLGPTLDREGLSDKKIIVWDHNRDLINHRVNTILSDPKAAAYAWGVGFHWYETWTGGEPMYDNLDVIQDAYPDHHLVFTEGTPANFSHSGYTSWDNAERYGGSMINDFNQGTVAWTDWNILLDDKGGPNHVGNFCMAPIHAISADSLIFTPSYFYIGHFSKFIKPGAVRVSTASSRSSLLATSFKQDDGSMASVVMNHTDEPIDYLFYVGDKATALSIPAHAIQTLCY